VCALAFVLVAREGWTVKHTCFASALHAIMNARGMRDAPALDDDKPTRARRSGRRGGDAPDALFPSRS
jgi:hypothetical protein